MMQQDKVVTVSFGLREIMGARRLARLEIQSTGDATCCGPQECSLTFAEGAPLFRADSARRAQRVLVVNTPWFNSTHQSPAWGQISTNELEVVQITEVLEVAAVAMSRPMTFAETLDVFQKSREVCAFLVGRELPDLDTRWSLRLVQVPESETAEGIAAKCTEATVFFGKDNLTQAYCWGVAPLPEDLKSRIEAGREGVLLCVSSNHPDDFVEV